MYVRCPVDEDLDEARTYFMGQITHVDDKQGIIKVVFHDPSKLRSFFVSLPDTARYEPKFIKRVSALSNSLVIFKGRRVKLLSVSKTPDPESPFYNYIVEYFADGVVKTGEVSETQIEIPFTRANFNPAFQMINFELQNPQWYLKRRIVSKSLNIISNSPSGFKNLLGTRVHLFRHQVDTIIRALSESPCRLMLADEVGLGKTIEALSIIKGITDKRPNMRSLIIVPETLIYQWQTELSFKFWTDAPIWGVDRIDDPKILLISSQELIKNQDKIMAICKWDMCVVDEAHKLLVNDNLYNSVLALCETTENILLLSATPILHRENEYHKLLTLLNPTRYKQMDVNDLGNLLNKQRNITDIVFNLMRDLSDYSQYNLTNDYIEGLTQINDEIKDIKLAKLISIIDSTSEDRGLSIVKLALSYIAEFYQIERNIIRHRRAELTTTDTIRKLIPISYEMASAETGFYEENTYNALLDYIDTIRENNNDVSIEYKKLLISAVSSSPYALYDLITTRVKDATTDNMEFRSLRSYINSWKDAFDNEISRINEIRNDIDSFQSKFSKIIDHIDQEDINCNKKYLIFTAFTKTALKLEECFKTFFGAETVTSFHKEKTQEQMQDAASQFQNDEHCRFMICDESGGEGRNFQIADFIIHCDLPWSPAVLEQRIGRLDRIGRDNNKAVVSIVVYSEGTIENDLFNIYNQGLNVFCESLCGMEIAFEQIHNTITNSLNEDTRFGLSRIIDEIISFSDLIKTEIEKERYFDLARQLDIDLQERLDKLIRHFTDNDGAELMNTMMAWPEMAGFTDISISDVFHDGSKVISIDTSDPNHYSMLNTLYFPPKMSDIIKHSKYKNDIRGTFSRSAAMKHENLTFFAPYNAFFDSITGNSEECYKGRCCAFKYTGCNIEFTGVVTTWNIRYNPTMLYKNGYSNELVSLISRYMPLNQVDFTNGINPKFDDVPKEGILEQIEISSHEKPIHLGKRENGAIDKFKSSFTHNGWKDYIKKAYGLGKKYVTEQARIFVESDKAQKELERMLTTNSAREIFYGYADDSATLKDSDMISALIYGLENPIIELDSIAFVILQKRV